MGHFPHTKGWRLEPDVVKAGDPGHGYHKRRRGWEEKDLYGSLEEGQKADLILSDPNLNADMLPIHDPIANLVTSMHSTNITHTMCDGKWLMKDGICSPWTKRPY